MIFKYFGIQPLIKSVNLSRWCYGSIFCLSYHFPYLSDPPVNSGWEPEPNSRIAETLPFASDEPSVGSSTPAWMLRSVLFPEPFWPMMPTVAFWHLEAYIAKRPEVGMAVEFAHAYVLRARFPEEPYNLNFFERSCLYEYHKSSLNPLFVLWKITMLRYKNIIENKRNGRSLSSPGNLP